MSANQEYLLIDHLDKALRAGQMLEADKLIRNDKEIAQQWERLKLAVQGIEYTGLREQVATVSKEWEAQNQVIVKTQPAVVRTLYRTIMRVAACIFLIIGSTAVYKYVTVSSEGLYNEFYTSYDLNTSRGAGTVDKLEQAYRDKNWGEVTSLSPKEKNNKSYFLAGMASLELKKYDLAIANFEQVIAANTRSGDNYFGDEAEYYLAMSLMANNEAARAVGIMERIRADKNHLYNKKVSEISGMDLKIILFKSSK